MLGTKTKRIQNPVEPEMPCFHCIEDEISSAGNYKRCVGRTQNEA